MNLGEHSLKLPTTTLVEIDHTQKLLNQASKSFGETLKTLGAGSLALIKRILALPNHIWKVLIHNA
jgi:hypothetical protein